MWTRIARGILKNRPFFIVLISAITLFFATQTLHLEMSYKHAPMLPLTDTVYKEFQHFEKLFHNERNVIVLGLPGVPLENPENYKQWIETEAQIKNLEGVLHVLSVTSGIDLLKDKEKKVFRTINIFPDTIETQEELDQAVAKLRNLPIYDGRLWNSDDNTMFAAVVFEDNMLLKKGRERIVKKLIRVIETYEKEAGIDVRVSGLRFIRITTAEIIKRELLLFVLLAVLVTALIIFILFRSKRVVFISLIVVAISVIWALGSMALFGYKISVITGMLPPLLIVIGIPNSVFMFNKFQQEYKNHGNKIKAIQRTIRKIGNATMLTNLTTASGFATFIITKSPILVEFGVVAALNIICIFIISIIIIPIALSYAAPPSSKHMKHLKNRFFSRWINILEKIVLHHRNWVYIGIGGIVIVGVAGIAKLKVSGYMVDDVPNSHSMVQDLRYFEAHFDGVMPLEILVDTQRGNGALKATTLKKAEELQEKLSKLNVLSAPLSNTVAVKFARQAFYNGNPSYYSIPGSQELSLISRYLPKSNGFSDITSMYVDSLKRSFRISYSLKDLGTDSLQVLKDTIGSIVGEVFPAPRYKTYVTGGAILNLAGTNYLIKNLFVSLVFAIVIISIFIALMFSSRKMVFVALIPNLIPLLLTTALMGFLGIPIKISTILVFSIAFGISVDDTIHYLAKYRQELKETSWSISASVVLALREVGMSMIYTSIILFFGFSIFGLSQFGGTSALGILVSITLLMAMNTNLLLLPSLLLSLDRRVTTRAFKEPLLTIYDEEEDIDLNELKIQK